MMENKPFFSLSFSKSKAYVNWIFFDEQFKTYEGGIRVSMVGANSAIKDHYSEFQNIIAGKSGYVYIYVSNESPVNVLACRRQVL